MKKIFLIAIINILVINLAYSQVNTLRIEVENFKSNKGKLGYQLFDGNRKSVNSGFVKISNKSAIIIIDSLEIGNYAVRLYHDKNNNSKMDFNFMGIPKEMYGYSNNAKGSMGPPKFTEQLFEIIVSKTIKIKMTK